MRLFELSSAARWTTLVMATMALTLAGACSKKAKVEAEQDVGADNPDASAPPFVEAQMELENIYFDYNEAMIREEAKAVLAAHAEWLKANENVQLQIEGHCDERGTEEYNLALGELRANAVKDYLVSMGVNSDRIYTISYGEELPVDPEHNEAAWAKNRRAQFSVTYQ